VHDGAIPARRILMGRTQRLLKERALSVLFSFKDNVLISMVTGVNNRRGDTEHFVSYK